MSAAPDALFDFSVDGVSQHPTVAAFSGTERISALYRFSVRVECPPIDAKTLEQSYIGQPCHLRFGVSEPRRWTHGVVRSMAVVGAPRGRPDMRFYSVEVVPRFGLLAFKTNSRIFQGKTVGEIVA